MEIKWNKIRNEMKSEHNCNNFHAEAKLDGKTYL